MNNRLLAGVRAAHAVVAWLYVVAILVQVLLIGLNLFAGEATREAHIGFGHVVGVLPLLMLILAFAGRLPRLGKGLAAWQFGLFLVQAEVFAAIRGSAPVLAAFHPVLALVVFASAVYAARRAMEWARVPGKLPAAIEQAPA